MVSVNRLMYAQADYDCQVCSKPETDAMRKRLTDFVRPTCDECIERLAHESHKRGDFVTVGRTTYVSGVDEDGRPLTRQESRKIRYEDWEFRCGRCSEAWVKEGGK